MPAPEQSRRRALVVFGGTGFVGSAVLKAALRHDEDLEIFVVSRRGDAPAWLTDDRAYRTARLHFLRGDLLAPESVRDALEPVLERFHIVACISCVGAITPWSQENMVRMCGDANVNAYTLSKEMGARKFAVITRDRSNMDDWWYPFPRLLPGYYEGKRKIEKCVEDDVANAGNAVCLRAGFVAGTRRTIPGLPTSWKIDVPLDGMIKLVERLCPTIEVDDLARAAVRFVLSERKAERVLVSNDEIPNYFEGG